MATIKKIKTVFQFRRATTAEWDLNSNIIPAAGEPCYDLDLKTLRIGDGATPYKDLRVIGSIESGDTSTLQAEIDAIKKIIATLQTDVADVQQQVGDADVAAMQENVTNLTTQINEMDTEIVTIYETLENKADVETVTTLQTAVEQKVDTETVELLETELKTYVDEQIKLVETGNIDDGEI